MDDAEEMAGLVLREAMQDGADRPDVWAVAKRMRVSVYKAPRTAKWSELGERVRVNGEDRVYLRSDVSEPLRTVVLAHELGHITVSRFALRLEDEERWCNRFAAALIAPEPSVWRAWRRANADPRTYLASWWATTPTLAALRLGECRCADVWIVEGSRVRYARAERQTPEWLVQAAREAVNGGELRRAVARLGDGAKRVVVALERDEWAA